MDEFVIYLGNYRYAGEPYAGIHGYGIEKIEKAKPFESKASAQAYADRHIGRAEFPSICWIIPKSEVKEIMPV